MWRNWSRNRGQSNTVAVALLLSVVVMASLFTLSMHTSTINNYQSLAENEGAEDAMMFLASAISSVAHSPSDTTAKSQFMASKYGDTVTTSSGSIMVSIENPSGSAPTQVIAGTLGGVVYTGRSGTKIAYQSGGVWRNSGGSGHAQPVSPPQITYENGTLTFPVIRITEGSSFESTTVQVEQVSTTRVYPSPSNGRENPVSDITVRVRIHSQYYRAWGQVFEAQTPATVTYNSNMEMMTAELTIPSSETGYLQITETVVRLS